MLNQIARLRRQRQSIVQLLKEIKSTGASNPLFREMLTACTEALIIHLDEQTRQFYPAVIELLDVSEDTEFIILKFDREISLIKEEATRITNRFMSSNNEIEFHRDFKVFFTGLQLRFLREEQLIFSKAEELLTLRYQHIL